MAGKSAFPENHPLSVGASGHTITRTAAHFLVRSDLVFGIGCSFARGGFSAPIPDGQEAGPGHARRARHRQGLRDRPGGRRRRPAGAAPADRRGQASDCPRRARRRRRPGRGPPAQRGRPPRVAAAPDRRRDADQPVPGDLGPEPHARSRQHDHHPRLGQPARPDADDLRGDRAARLPRLGQVHPARHRAGHGARRQAGPPRQDGRQHHGRPGLRHRRHGGRDGGARAAADHDGHPEQLGHGRLRPPHADRQRALRLEPALGQLRRRGRRRSAPTPSASSGPTTWCRPSCAPSPPPARAGRPCWR